MLMLRCFNDVCSLYIVQHVAFDASFGALRGDFWQSEKADMKGLVQSAPDTRNRLDALKVHIFTKLLIFCPSAIVHWPFVCLYESVSVGVFHMFLLYQNQTSGHPLNSIHKQSEAESTDVCYIMIETCSAIPGLGNGCHSHGCPMRFSYILDIFIYIKMLFH